jgi:ATP synthase protein I
MSNERPIEVQLWRGAIIPALSVAVLGNIFALVLRGTPGFVAGIFSLVIVVIFFAVHLAIAKIADRLDPTMVMVLAMGSYIVKVTFMGLFLVVTMKFTEPKFLDRPTFAVMAIAITSAWLAGEIRAFLKLKLVLKTTKE